MNKNDRLGKEPAKVKRDSKDNGKSLPKINSKQKKIVLAGMCAVCVIVFLFSAVKLISILNEYRKSREAYNSLASAVAVVNCTPEGTAQVSDANKLPEESAEPKIIEYAPVSVDFKQLKETNTEIVGWLYSSDTVINYPVMHCEDNQKYMHTLFNNEYNAGGSLFTDMLCEEDFSSYNNVIYGHNMNDGSMFASLEGYRDEKYFNEHSVLYLLTPEQDYKVLVFSTYVTPYDSDTYTIQFSDVDEYDKLLAKMVGQSEIKSDVELQSGDKIVTMSTCVYDYNDARLVVHGKLVPIGE